MPMIPYLKDNLYHSPLPGDARFLGAIEEKFARVIFCRMTSDDAQNVVFGEAEGAFLHCVDDEKPPVGIWQGEFWGKLIISACRACRYTGDAELKAFIRSSVERVLSHQRKDGYLGTYQNERHVFAADPAAARAAGAGGGNWTWNVWCRKYTLWGLLEAADLLGDDEILRRAAASADQLIAMLDDMGAHICETGVFFGLPSASILKPMLILYRRTGEKRYLDFALSIADAWEDDKTLCNKIIKNSLAGLPVHTWAYGADAIPCRSTGNPFKEPGAPALEKPQLNQPETAGKVYEMLSCFDGLLELYRVTGTKRYLDASEAYFRLLMRDEYNTVFSVGFNDLFLHAAANPNSMSELCDVLHFMRFSSELFLLTGRPEYMDVFELAFYNPFLAGVARDGSWAARGVRPSEGHMYALLQAGFTHNHCCTDNMPRGFTNAADLLTVCNRDDVCMNLYSPFRAVLHPTENECVRVSVGEGYFTDCRAEITVDAALISPKTLRLRIPAWSKTTVLTAGGNDHTLTCPGTYYELPLENGVTVLTLQFDKTPRLIEDNCNLGFYPFTPYFASRYFSPNTPSNVHEDTVLHENKARLCVGPLLLAAARTLGSTKEEIFDHKTVRGRKPVCTVTPKQASGFLAAYDVTVTCADGDVLRLPMGDFASASDEMEHMDYRYTIFL